MSSNSVTSTAREHVFPLFVKYVSANVLGMIGYSCYILADTFFVARGIGSDAIAALNLVLPAFSLLNGTGLMIGMGAAARYSLSSGRADSEIHRTIFTQALQLAFIAMLFFFSIGLFFARPLCVLLGADGTTLPHAIPYISILLMFSPLFLCNNLLNCFVRNDGEPRLSMTAMLVGSLTNIVLDYIFIYPMQLGMTGAALMFIYLVNVFNGMPGGKIVGIIFYICVLFAGMSSLVNLYEAPVATLQERFGLKRVSAVGIIAAFGCCIALLIQGIVSGWMDAVSIYICPLGAMLAAIMFFWIADKEFALKAVNTGREKKIGTWFLPLGKYVLVPLALVALIAGAVLGGIG